MAEQKKPKPGMKDAVKEWVRKQIESAVAPAIKGSERDKMREKQLKEMGARNGKAPSNRRVA